MPVFQNTWLKGLFELIDYVSLYVYEYIIYLLGKIVYKRSGKCLQCGKCCRHVYLRDKGKIVSSFSDCLKLIKSDPQLNQFFVRGSNSDGELYFSCKYVGRDNECTKYKKRPLLCKTYPSLSMIQYGAVPKEDCGFFFVNRFTGKSL